jgi:hypothetical protein
VYRTLFDLITLQLRRDFMTLSALPSALSFVSFDRALADIDFKGVCLEAAFPDR